MLKIPTSSDTPPPLMAPLRKISAEEVVEAPQGEPKLKKRRRSSKGGNTQDHSWEHQSRSSRSSTTDGKQMKLMLIGGTVVFALIVGAVMVSMRGGKSPQDSNIPSVSSGISEKEEPSKSAEPVVVVRTEPQILAETEPMARKFAEAKTVEEILPLIRHPEKTEPRLRKLYPDGKIEPPGLSTFNSDGEVSVNGKLISIAVATRDFEQRVMVFAETPEGMKIDWESWEGWSEMPWDQFVTEKPVAPHLFRVILTPVAYYNFDFADEAKWQSYRLISPDGERSLYGYVPKDSILDKRIRPNMDTKKLPMMLMLKYPAGATSANQVEIETMSGEGWVEEEGGE